MPLSAVNMVQNGHLIHPDIKQFFDLFTGAMSDQPITFATSVQVGSLYSTGSTTTNGTLVGTGGTVMSGNLPYASTPGQWCVGGWIDGGPVGGAPRSLTLNIYGLGNCRIPVYTFSEG